MLIDRSHRNWAVLTTLLLTVASVLYVVYARSWPGGPSGRTWPGMLFGIAGTLLMLFAGALTLRKKTLRLQLGSLSWWLRAHIWLGSLSVPLILYHAAFRWGGTVEVLLWIALALVIVSGVIGLALQNVLPRMMKLELPSEAIPDQMAEICRRLVLAADERVTAQCTPAAVEAAIQRSPGEGVSPQSDPRAWLAGFYIQSVRPFLGSTPPGNSPLADAQQAQLLLDRVRSTLPDDCHPTVDELEESCELRRQLAQQERLHRLLHLWLRVHVPCSVALLVFGVIHIISALYY
jgi:hypothetical protein